MALESVDIINDKENVDLINKDIPNKDEKYYTYSSSNYQKTIERLAEKKIDNERVFDYIVAQAVQNLNQRGIQTNVISLLHDVEEEVRKHKANAEENINSSRSRI